LTVFQNSERAKHQVYSLKVNEVGVTPLPRREAEESTRQATLLGQDGARGTRAVPETAFTCVTPMKVDEDRIAKF
jgi:hypothetical protein